MSGNADDSDGDPLTEEQQHLFDRGFRKCEQKLLRTACKIVGRANAEEVVHNAVAWLVFLVTRRKKRCPTPCDEAAFARKVTRLVYKLGKSTVGSPDRPQLVHSFWGKNLASHSGQRDSARLLSRDMVDVDRITVQPRVDASEMTDRDRRVQLLGEIFRFDTGYLGTVQARALSLYMAEVPNREAAKQLGISIKTYDNTLRRTKDRMRELALRTRLWADLPFPALNDWMETFAELEEERIAARFRKAKSQKAEGAAEEEGKAAA